MTWWAWVLIAIYVVGFILTFWSHVDSPATLGLALLRSLVWPLFWATGRPYGQPEVMD